MASGEQITGESIEAVGDYPVFGGNGLRGFTNAYTHDGHYALIGRQGALCGNINFANGKFWASEHAVVVSPKLPCSVRWLGELLRTMNLGQYSITAAQPGLSVEAVANLRIPIPPSAEQSLIAAFLARETAKIDGLVEEQRRLVELLKEKRQAVISHAVTKGLDPTVPMKDSGVEWLGEVPAHWEVKKLGSVCSKIGSGKTPRGGAEAYVDEGVTFLRSQNVYDDGLWLDELVYIDEETDREMSNTRVESGDILLNITGASLGRTCVVPEGIGPANVNQHVCIIRLRSAGQKAFVAMALKSTGSKAQIDALQNGAAREGLNFQQLAALKFASPSEPEGQKIAEELGRVLVHIDALSAQADAAITLLQERRSALISAAVTGKIDVRGLVARETESA